MRLSILQMVEKITVRLIETHNNVILSITDQGLGIPKKDISRIFDRFYRVDKARARKQGGTGLGLAISKEVVKALGGGTIWATSIENYGSTFYISLPYEPFERNGGIEIFESWDSFRFGHIDCFEFLSFISHLVIS